MKHKSKALVAFATIAIIAAGAGSLVHRWPMSVGMVSAPSAATASQLWTCGMHPQVIQDHPGNCPICHMKLVPLRGSDSDAVKTPHVVAYWWDPMLGPSSIAHAPGKSAMGMDLVPVYEKDVAAGPGVHIDPAVVQNMGVRTAAVTRGPLHATVRAVATLEVPEPAAYDVTLKFGAYIDKLYADTAGMAVTKGEVLFDVYSPELQVVEQELIAANQTVKSLGNDVPPSTKHDAQRLLDSTRRRLRLWDLADQDIDAIEASTTPPRTMPFRSPASGHIEDKSIVTGSAASVGQKLMRIESHVVLWLDAQVYEDQIEQVKLGQSVHAVVEGLPGQMFIGAVSYLAPHLDHMTRTEIVRVQLENSSHALRPGMYATVDISTLPVDDAVHAPREAIIDTGTKQIVFVADPTDVGHFAAREVTAGAAGDGDEVQILSGLAPGEQVVTSGQFLMDVESRTTAAIEKLRGGHVMATPMAMQALPATSPVAVGNEMLMPATQPMPLIVVHCPMKDADWLQVGEKIANPYFGTAMPDCGNVTRHLPMPAVGTPINAVVNAYLSVGANLNADRMGSVANLKQSIDAMPTASPALHQVAAAMLAATDIRAERAAFSDLGKALIASLSATDGRMEMR